MKKLGIGVRVRVARLTRAPDPVMIKLLIGKEGIITGYPVYVRGADWAVTFNPDIASPTTRGRGQWVFSSDELEPILDSNSEDEAWAKNKLTQVLGMINEVKRPITEKEKS